MARTVRDKKLDYRDGRLRLERGVRHWKGIHDGLALGYRRGAQGSGVWSARLRLGSGRYVLKSLGVADDYADADGRKILALKDAQKLALTFEAEEQSAGGGIDRKLTVKKATEDYLAWFREHKKGVTMAESAIRAHILPIFGDRAVASLQSKELRDWLDELATKPARLRTGKFATKVNARPAPKSNDQKRARKATANRIFAVLKAVLNRAYRDGKVVDDSAWRKVKPFEKVDEARIRFLTDAECVRLVNACPTDLRALVRAALLTGARWGELTALQVFEVTTKGNAPTIYVAESKSGKPRHIPLNAEGCALFAAQVAAKASDARVFVRSDGEPWGHNHHVRALNKACRAAKLRPAVRFHELRHAYASHLAPAGIPLLTISKLLGHADTRITERHYAHLADKTLAAAVTSLPSFEPDRRRVVEEVPEREVA